MKYQYKCTNKDCERYLAILDVEQAMDTEHVADCPVCNLPTQRIYTPLPHTWGKNAVDWTKNGKRIINPDEPSVPSGTKWFGGYTLPED